MDKAKKANSAQQLLAHIGVAVGANVGKQAHGDQTPSATKHGSGRYHSEGKPGNRIAKDRKVRAYVALMAAWAAKRVPKWRGARDDHGVVCLIGKPYELVGVHPTSRELVLGGWVDGKEYGYTVQRKWLAGISAQRGY